MKRAIPGPCLAPSILSADFSILREEISRVAPHSGLIHIDVMDNHFVPNLTIGPPVVRSLSKAVGLPLDCHLMVENPDRLVKSFAEAGASLVSVHVEGNPHLHRTIDLIKREGMAAGVALNPSTPVCAVEEILPDVDFVLVMSVNPGFGGQNFIESSVDKIARIRGKILARGLSAKIEVDGGVGPGNLDTLRKAGAEWFVAGNSVFGAASPEKAAAELAGLIDG